MSDTDSGFDPDDFVGLEEKTRNVPTRQIKRWEEQTKELNEARRLLAEMKREQVFARAGIPDTAMGNLFRRGYDGQDDVDAIKAAAIEYGILNAPAEQDKVNQSLAGHEAAQAAASGAATPDPRVDLDSRMRAAKSPQELAQILEEAGVKPQDLHDFPALRS